MMEGVATYILLGLALGASAGFSPGPLQMLVISESLRHHGRHGVMASFAPLITDAPIVVATVLVLSRLSGFDFVTGVISLLGSGFLAYLAYENFTHAGMEVGSGAERPRSLRKAVITNFLSPVPYAFWLFVGAPAMVEAMKSGLIPAAAFIASFYAVLVGTLIVIALLAGRSKSFLRGRAYGVVVRLLGVVLLVFALLFLRNGLRLMGVL